MSPQAAETPHRPSSESGPTGSICVLDHNRDSLRLWFEQQGLPAFRADQVLKWVYQKAVGDLDRMTDLSKDLRDALRGRMEIFRSKIVKESRAADGVIKLLLKFPPAQHLATEAQESAINIGQTNSETPSQDPAASIPASGAAPTPCATDPVHVECVMIPQEDRRTACLSTQAGCPVGCVFCASGMQGLQRNLTSGEIVEQLLRLQAALGADKRMTHVVIMGMGEPLANFDATVDALYTINEKETFGLGARHITVSTVGLPQRIRDLADHNLQINLAISLHAPTDALRRELIPWASHFTIQEIFEAARYYFDITGREITLEYVMLAGINDHMTQAQQLAKVARMIRCSVNLIPFNPVEGLEYKRPRVEQVYAFQEVLRQAGVRTKVRKSRGLEADAACGQLRRREILEDKPQR
jgi:23S rRNA (adenine2503-C2)-methyltransferase